MEILQLTSTITKMKTKIKTKKKTLTDGLINRSEMAEESVNIKTYQ